MMRHLLAAIALAALIALWWLPQEAELSGEVFLRTPGASEIPEDLPHLKIGSEPDRSSEVVPDLATLVRRFPAVDRLRVGGYGLPEWEWSSFQGEIDFEADSLDVAPGIRHLSWPRRLVLGEEWVVEGVAEDLANIHLDGPGGRAASTAPEDGVFTLKTRPRALGRFLYRLKADRGGEWALDVEVIEPMPPTVLWLEGAPSFEARHFKEWLVDRGGRAVVVSRVSRDRLRTERGGFEAGERPGLGDLSPFDLVIIDPEFKPPQGLSDWLQEGGGVLLRIDASDDLDKVRLPGKTYSLRSIDDLDRWAVAPRFPGDEPLAEISIVAREVAREVLAREVAREVPGTSVYEVSGTSIVAREVPGTSVHEVPGTSVTTVPLLEDAAGRFLGVWHPRGLGREGVQLVHDTYRWRLEGEETTYGRFWSGLLSTLARSADSERVIFPEGPLFVDEPIDLHFLDKPEHDASATVTSPSGELVSLTVHAGRARWWPRTEGWHQIVDAWVYVQASSWETWRGVRSIEATRRAALRPVLRAAEDRVDEDSREIPDRFLLWTLFLVSIFSLWAYERFQGKR